MSLLITGDEAGTLVLSVNGLFPIVCIQLSGPAATAIACCTSGDLQTLHIWIQTVDGPKLETYDIEFLSVHQVEVFSTVAAYLTIASLLGRAADARSAAAKAWSNAVLPLDRKLAIYNRALQNWHAGRGSSPMARSKLLTLVTLFQLVSC